MALPSECGGAIAVERGAVNEPWEAMTMARRWITLGVNLALAAIILTVWLKSVFRVDIRGALTAPGLRSLKYFTVLSNLLQAAASLATSLWLARLLCGRSEALPGAVMALRYAAVTSVALTFFTVAVFLGPPCGYRGMYTDSNLWFHLLVPIVSAVDFCFIEREGALPPGAWLWALLPMLLYAVGYTVNLFARGMAPSADWYGFAKGGSLRMALISFVTVALSTGLLAWLLGLARRIGQAVALA